MPLVFDHQIDWAGIGYPDGTPYVSLSCPGFTSFGIWAAKGAPFVCLEPWLGRADNYGFTGDLSEKPDINRLKPTKRSTHSTRSPFTKKTAGSPSARLSAVSFYEDFAFFFTSKPYSTVPWSNSAVTR